MEKISVAKDSAEEPATVKEALESPQHAERKEAMEAEMQSLQADGKLMVGVYVDDIVIGGKSEKKTKEFKLALGEKLFDVKYLERLHYFLGMKIAEDAISGDVWMGQPAYIQKVLNKFGMKDAKSVATPVDASTRLTKAEGREEEVGLLYSRGEQQECHGYSDSDWVNDRGAVVITLRSYVRWQVWCLSQPISPTSEKECWKTIHLW